MREICGVDNHGFARERGASIAGQLYFVFLFLKDDPRSLGMVFFLIFPDIPLFSTQVIMAYNVVILCLQKRRI